MLLKKNALFIGILVILGIVLYLFSRTNYLFFHLIVESSVLIIGILIFTLSIISEKFGQSSFIVTLGPGILVASLITFIHVATFKGMNIIPGYEANLSTQLWVVLNYILAVSIFIAILSGNKKTKFGRSMLVFFCIGALGTWMCFAGIFPTCYVEGAGLTAFKKVSEYVIISIYLLCLVLIYRKRFVFDKKTYITMLLFLSLLITGEFMFTLYSDVYGILNFIGHYFRLVAFLIIYIFVVVESIQKPFNSIFSELKDLSIQFESIFDHIPGLVFYKDTENNFVRVNKYVADAHNIPKIELEGKNLENIYPLADAKKYYEDDLVVIKSGEAKNNIVEPWENKEGVRWINTSKIPFKNNKGEIIGVLGLAFDITEIKNAEQKIKILQQAVEQSPASIIITEIDGTICYVNRAFELITGYTSEEAIGKNPRILKLNKETQIDYEELWKTILSGKEWRGIFENKKKNGEAYWESTSISPIFDENANIVNFLAIKEDFTEKRRFEMELERLSRIDYLTKERLLEEENEKNIRLLNETILSEKLKTDFFSNLSHELKTPLNVILSTLQLLDTVVSDSDGDNIERVFKKYSNIMKQNCYRQLRLVNNMIDITKVDAGFFELNLQNFNIVNIVESVCLSVSEYIKTKSIELIFDTDIEECIMSCDSEKIERVILNLLSNSIKFTEPGGSITVNMYDKGENIVISIKDTGIGIPKDKLDIIFDRFRQVDKSFTRNQEGSGIGLSIVKSLVELHGGEISVRSEYGKGTEFIIVFPVKLLLEENAGPVNEADSHELIQRLHIEFSDIYSLN